MKKSRVHPSREWGALEPKARGHQGWGEAPRALPVERVGNGPPRRSENFISIVNDTFSRRQGALHRGSCVLDKTGAVEKNLLEWSVRVSDCRQVLPALAALGTREKFQHG